MLYYEDTGDMGDMLDPDQQSGSVPEGDLTGSDNPGTLD
jgi:hypothetical protein